MSLQILQGGIQPWAPVGGGKSRRSIALPPKNQENFVPVIWGNFCFILHVGAFLLRFSHYSFALAGGGGNRRQLPPLKESAIWGAFLLPFLYVGAFLLRFSHYNFAPAEREGARLGVRPSLKNEEKICFAI